MQRLIKCGLSVVVAGFILGTWGVAIGAAPSGPDLRAQFFSLVDNEPLPWPVESVQITSNTLVICLDVTPAVLQAAEGLGAEEVEETVARALMPLEWRVLHVLARDPASGECRPLSDFLPRPKPRLTAQETPRLKPAASPEAATFPRSLAGKTVYVSAGHGWQWNGTAWRTQRPPYEEFIEDHNNAEAVAQFLIPYLENAGATVIPVRERDWNAARVIADNDDLTTYTESGSWYTSLITGYAGGSYRFARTVTETATATAAWTLMVPQQGNYALYAWVDSNPNRVRDAHYTIHHAGGSSPVYLDQRIRPETWRYLGTFPCYTGPLTVTLDNHSSVAGDYLIADALRLGGGQFDELAGIGTTAPAPPDKPWWEAATFYYSQWMGLAREEWLYFSDVTARPMYARWQHRGVEEDAIYLSWHTNGYNGHNTVVSGTVSYVYNNSSEYYKRTEGSLELQQAVHEELVHDIRTGWEVGWRDLGERQLNLGEVRMLWDDDPANRMPGVLLEIGYHDNVHDANALKEPRFNRLAARAVYQGVVAYFEEQGSVDLVTAPEPPERLRVQNVGGGGVRIAWQPSLTDTVGLRGEAATGYRVYTSTDGFGWGAPLAVTGTEVTLTGFAPGETCYIRLRAINDGGQSLPTEVLGARVGDYAPLLIVNGFDKMNRFDLVPEIDPTEGYNLRLWMEQINSRDYVVQHGAATPAHYAWDSAGNEVVAAGEVVLGDYALVDWLLGEESLEEDGTLNAAERAALTEFVGAGGALLISGSELAWDLVAQGRDPAFMSDTLHAGYVADDADTHTVAPAAGGIFAGLAAFSFDAPGEYNVDYPDVLTATAGATVTLHYADDVGKPAAVQYADGCARTLLLGFPFEVIRPAARGDVMARALDFLDECLVAPLRAVITAPDEGSYLNATPVFTGTAMGEGLRRVEVQAANGGTGSYWDGGDWITSTTWLTATGTATWSYTLPALPDGDYLLRARAVATETGESAQVQFMLDTVAPLTPTVLTPTQGLTLTTWQVELRWLAPADVGSPLSYQVAVDGVTCTVVSTVHPILLGAGPHCWRVRAVDAAGNIGPWTAEAHFTVELREVFLPLVLRNYAGATPPACETFLAESFESAGGGDWLLNAAKRVTEPVYAGDWAMRVGIPPGETGSDYSSIRRELTFPANATITLHYHVYPLIENDDSEDYHYVGPAGGLEITRSDSRSWEERSMDLTAYAGEEITLYFGVFNDGDENVASLTVDEIIIEVCYH